MRVTLLLTVLLCAFAQEGYEQDIATAFAKAKKQKKPLWIMFSATWCAPCKFVEKEILPDKKFQEVLQKNFVPLHVFAASGAESSPGGDSLADLYQIRAYPTFLYVEPTGEVFFRSEGVPRGEKGSELSPADFMLRQVEAAQKARKDLPAFRKRYQKGERSVEFLRSYLFFLIELGAKEELRPVLRDYLKAAGSVRRAWLAEPGMVEKLADLVEVDPAQSEYAYQIADTLRQYLTPSEFESLYRGIVPIHFSYTMGKGLLEGEAPVALEKVRAYIKRYRASLPMVERIALREVIDRWWEHPDSMRRKLAVDLAIEVVFLQWPLEIPEAGRREMQAVGLNNIAWRFYESVEAPDKLWVAVGWAKQALAYMPDAWYIWDTLGALYYKLGRKAEAIQALEKALQLAKQAQIPADEYQETQELLEKAQNLPD